MSVPGAGQEPNPQAGQEPGGAAATTAQPAAATPGQEPAAAQQPQPERYDAEYVKELRKSEAATRKRLQELEARVKADDDAKLSETDRLTKRAAEAEQRATDAEARARQALVRSAVMVELGKQGAANPSKVFLLVEQAGLEIADDGTVTGADKAVERLLKDEPYLKAAQSTNGHGGPPQTPRAADERALSEQQRSELQDQERRRYASAF